MDLNTDMSFNDSPSDLNANDSQSDVPDLMETVDDTSSADAAELGTESLMESTPEAIEEAPVEVVDPNDNIVESLRGVEGLNETEWPESDRSERLAILQNAENVIAEAHGRPPVEITVDDNAEPGLFGSYNPETNSISVSGWHIDQNDVHEITDTIAHEGRHAYQDYAIQNPGFHSDPDEVEAWRDNMDNYLDATTHGQEAYANQPLEADAWQNGSAIAESLFPVQPESQQ